MKPKVTFSHSLCLRKCPLVFVFADLFYLAKELAIPPVAEQLCCNHNELLPVVPFTDYIFDLPELFHERLAMIGVRHSKNIAQLLNLKPIRMQILPTQTG